MGTAFEVRIPASIPGSVELACQALDRIDVLESQLTVYREDSGVSRINRVAHLEPVFAEKGLFHLLETASRISHETGGKYDVTSGALSLAWGFTRGPKRVPTNEERLDALSRTGMSHLSLDATNQTVAFDCQGVGLNFGSIGKGYAIDEAARLVAEYPWPTSALIHGGNSSVFALGSPPGSLGGRWQVSLRNPFDPSRPLGEFALRNRGLGTSGAVFQQFQSGGKSYGHIIDSQTGFPPEEGPVSVSVLAPTAAEADALSTAFYLMGIEATSNFLTSRPEIAAIFVMNADNRRPPRIVLQNIDPADFSLDPTVHLAIASH